MAQKPSQESAAVGTNLLDLVDRFEAALRANSALRIEEYLATCPPDYQNKASSKRRNLLLALIQIDIGFSCRKQPKDVNRCFAPDYVKRFPELESVAPGASDVFAAELDAKKGLPGFDAIAFRTRYLPKNLPASEVEHATEPPRNEADTTPSSKRPPQTGGAAGNVPESEWNFLSPPKADDELGRLGPFRVLKSLGAGGMGLVFLAEDPALRRNVALKVMQAGLAQDPMARKRFLREAQAAAAIQHDNIVTIYQVGEANGVPFLAMQLLQGESLEQRLKREKTLPLADILRIGRQTAEGLAAAHEQGLIHRDIKPANIWLETMSRQSNATNDEAQIIHPRNSKESEVDAVYRVKILDFGLARSVDMDARLTKSGAVMGTPAYMAPEQAAGNTVDKQCDLFSLGCLLYHLANGESPFLRRDTLATLLSIAKDHPKPLSEVRPEVPIELSDLVAELLAKEPAKRPRSSPDVARRFSLLEAQFSSINSRSAPKRARRFRWLAWAALMLLPVAAGTAIFWWIPTLLDISGIGFSTPHSTNQGDNKQQAIMEPHNSGPKPIAQVSSKVLQVSETVKIDFVHIPKGTFWVGGDSARAPMYRVTVEEFEMAKYAVTQEIWEVVMGFNPSIHRLRGPEGVNLAKQGLTEGETRQFPVENVSWHEVQSFLKIINEREKGGNWRYCVPTRDQWEYAARNAPTTKEDCLFDFYLDAPTNNLSSHQSNFDGNFPAGSAEKGPFLNRPTVVGSYPPNKLGLYDMHGNVLNWCADLGEFRGGSFHWPGRDCRANMGYTGTGNAARDIGFRLARTKHK